MPTSRADVARAANPASVSESAPSECWNQTLWNPSASARSTPAHAAAIGSDADLVSM
jgi:hypothetical protein